MIRTHISLLPRLRHCVNGTSTICSYLEIGITEISNEVRKQSTRTGEAVAETINVEMTAGNQDRGLFVPHANTFAIVNSRVEKEAVVEEGHLMAEHVHMLLSIPPKYSVSGVVGLIKGKSAIAIARRFMDRAKNFVGQNFWARGY